MSSSKVRGMLVAGLLAIAISLEAGLALSAYLVRQHSVESAQRAARLTPADEQVYLRLADLDPDRRSDYLRRAAEVDRTDARPWLALAIADEASGNRTRAELDLQQAAKLDVRRESTWALADFYFRQNNMKGFYTWANRYRTFAGGNVTGLLRLAWTRNPKASALLTDFVPLSCDELQTMAAFVANHAAPGDVALVEQQLAACPGKQAVSLVMDGVSRLLSADDPGSALQTWNSLHQNAAFHYASLDTARGRILTNADFANQLLGSGFDWRINQTPGMQVRRLQQQHALEFSLDGSEPDVSTLLFQPVVLIAGNTYRLQCKIQADDGDPDGFRWRLAELSTGKSLPSGLDAAAGKQNDLLSWRFVAPASSRTLVLAFTYIRPGGEIRSQGIIRLSDVTLDPE